MEPKPKGHLALFLSSRELSAFYLEDGVPDALLRFTRPVSGGYFWCPPLLDGRLDLRVLTET